MRLTVISLLFLLLLAPSPVWGADALLDSVCVTGVDSYPPDDLARVLLSKPGGILNDGLVRRDRDSLAGYLREQGWWNAAVDAEIDSTGGRNILSFRITTGRRIRFGLVEVHMDSSIPGFEPGEYIEVTGKPFTKRDLDGITGDIISRLGGQGYPDVEIIPELTALGDSVDVVLLLLPGAQAYVDSIEIRGLKVTRDYVVRRELAALRGKPVSPEVTADARTAVGHLPFVHLSGEPVVEYTGQGRALLVVPLEEGTRGSFDGALGYQQASDGGSGEMIGKVNLGMENLFGTGRALNLLWENLGNDSENMELEYSEPWVFGYPVNLSGTFIQERRDAQGYTRTLFAFGAGRDIGRLHANAGLRYERTSSDSLTSASGTGIEAGVSWKALDAPSNPRSGLRYEATWSSVRKRYLFGSRERATMTRSHLSLDHFIPTARNQTIAVLISYRRVDAGKHALDPADRFWIGGASTLRGYREQMFPADRALLSAVEYRFLTGGTSRAFVFTDYGHLWNTERSGENTVTTTLSRVGYGFGIRVQSRAGTLGFDYGLGRGDGPGDGKLHVRLSTVF